MNPWEILLGFLRVLRGVGGRGVGGRGLCLPLRWPQKRAHSYLPACPQSHAPFPEGRGQVPLGVGQGRAWGQEQLLEPSQVAACRTEEWASQMSTLWKIQFLLVASCSSQLAGCRGRARKSYGNVRKQLTQLNHGCHRWGVHTSRARFPCSLGSGTHS